MCMKMLRPHGLGRCSLRFGRLPSALAAGALSARAVAGCWREQASTGTRPADSRGGGRRSARAGRCGEFHDVRSLTRKSEQVSSNHRPGAECPERWRTWPGQPHSGMSRSLRRTAGPFSSLAAASVGRRAASQRRPRMSSSSGRLSENGRERERRTKGEPARTTRSINLNDATKGVKYFPSRFRGGGDFRLEIAPACVSNLRAGRCAAPSPAAAARPMSGCRTCGSSCGSGRYSIALLLPDRARISWANRGSSPRWDCRD